MLKYNKHIVHLILVGAIFLANCDLKEKDPGKSILLTGDFQYDIHNPDKRYLLPGVLREISGIEILNDSILVCIEDERGKIYFYNQNQETIEHVLDFSGKGDYEGITMVDNTIYVLKSNGHIYMFPISFEESVESTHINTKLKGKNDAEGLAVYSKNTLLVACKGAAEMNDNELKGRAIYKYLIEDSILVDQPFIHLKSKEFEKALNDFNLNPLKHMPFGPSGIAVHPITHDVFLIGSVGRLALVINDQGVITDMGTLKSSVYVQPEGICFDSAGNLYIACEGKKGKGYILRFNYREMAEDKSNNSSNGSPK